MLPPAMLVSGARRAAASLALIATDSVGRPWASLPTLDPSRLSWSSLVGPETHVEVVEAQTLPFGSPMPRYEASAGVLNFAGLLFVVAPDAATLLDDTLSILDGLEAVLSRPEHATTDTALDATADTAIDYSTRPPTATATIELFRAAELNGPLDDPQRMQRMLDEAQYLLAARCGERLVGLVRVLTDFAFNAFVADLAVLPEFQRRGIGSRLLREATEPFAGVKFVVHPGDSDSAGFYEKHGFSDVGCMARPRSEATAS